MARPKITVKCVADDYANRSIERIVEFSDGLPGGKGGLIALRRMDDGTLRVDVYRTDDGVVVVGPRTGGTLGDGRFSVAREFTGAPEHPAYNLRPGERWVARFQGDWIGSSTTENGARAVADAFDLDRRGSNYDVADESAGTLAIKVDGEEIDHADTPAEAERHRNTIIYGGVGTEDNTTIERRPKKKD